MVADACRAHARTEPSTCNGMLLEELMRTTPLWGRGVRRLFTLYPIFLVCWADIHKLLVLRELMLSHSTKRLDLFFLFVFTLVTQIDVCIVSIYKYINIMYMCIYTYT